MIRILLAIFHRLQLTEVSRQQIEQELSIVNKEKVEIIEQFQHVKRLNNQMKINNLYIFLI